MTREHLSAKKPKTKQNNPISTDTIQRRMPVMFREIRQQEVVCIKANYYNALQLNRSTAVSTAVSCYPDVEALYQNEIPSSGFPLCTLHIL